MIGVTGCSHFGVATGHSSSMRIMTIMINYNLTRVRNCSTIHALFVSSYLFFWAKNGFMPAFTGGHFLFRFQVSDATVRTGNSRFQKLFFAKILNIVATWLTRPFTSSSPRKRQSLLRQLQSNSSLSDPATPIPGRFPRSRPIP